MFPMTSYLSDLHCLFQTTWNLGKHFRLVPLCVGLGVRRRKTSNQSKRVDQRGIMFLWNLRRSSESFVYFLVARGIRWSILWERVKNQVLFWYNWIVLAKSDAKALLSSSLLAGSHHPILATATNPVFKWYRYYYRNREKHRYSASRVHFFLTLLKSNSIV